MCPDGTAMLQSSAAPSVGGVGLGAATGRLARAARCGMPLALRRDVSCGSPLVEGVQGGLQVAPRKKYNFMTKRGGLARTL
mmetsp:Transcript_1202/g.2678  ORF Transcript_1202/g.2678 Transcript_1202/m.2678 type:complete len:81 (-) Transcript_1202:424-666(-)